MFNSICIKFHKKTFPTDLGIIAESLLYYQQVIIIGSADILPPILNGISKEVLVELFLNGSLRICVLRDFLAATGKSTDFGSIPASIMRLEPADYTTEDKLFKELYESNGRRGFSKKLLANILPYIEFIKYPPNIDKLIIEDLHDSNYAKSVFIQTIKSHIPDYNRQPEEFILRFTEGKGNNFGFQTSLNFNELNKRIPNNPKGDKFNPVSIVTNIQEARGDLHLASTYNSEIVTNPYANSFIEIKFSDIYQKLTKSRGTIQQFNEFTLNDGFAIREGINSGQYSFDEFLKILNQAVKFKKWLHEKPDDANLIREYHEAVTKDTWVEKLPAKALRWSIFTGIGLALDATITGGVATAIATGLGIGDTFLLDKIIKGWKPNMFIEKELKGFKK